MLHVQRLVRVVLADSSIRCFIQPLRSVRLQRYAQVIAGSFRSA
jgi:hypothetical protein